MLGTARAEPAASPAASLEASFRDPPQSARPRIWWHWMNGNVTKDGIAKDLAWMKRVGIGGLQNFDVNLQTPQVVEKRLVYMTPEWKDAFRFAASEADRLGLELAIASSPGWSETGGPWVKLEDGLKKLVWSAVDVAPGLAIEEIITGHVAPDAPRHRGKVGVYAFPVDTTAALPTLQASDGLGTVLDAAKLTDSDLRGGVTLGRREGVAPAVTLSYPSAVTVRSATVFLPDITIPLAGPAFVGQIEASDDGTSWRKLTDPTLSGVPTTASFAPVTARQFRLVLNATPPKGGLGAAEIERFFRDVENGKTAKNEKTGHRTRIIVKGGNGAARKVFRDFSAVLSFAKRYGIIDSHPCEKAVVKKTANARTRFLSLDELRRFGAACDALEAEGVNPKALNIARLWALTSCRRQEIVELKWSEVDFDSGLMMLADTKTGQSIRPLPISAMVLLKGIERAGGTEYVFPADTGESFFQGTKTIWQKIVKRADLPGVTPHTLRHTVGAIATSNGEALALTGAILGHSNLRLTMIYAHVDWDPSVKAANRVSDRISSALAGMDKQSSARRAESQDNGRAPSGGLLPAEEWDMLLDLAHVDPDTPGRLSSKDNGVLLRLARHGFAEKMQDLTNQLA
jgi:integrase